MGDTIQKERTKVYRLQGNQYRKLIILNCIDDRVTMENVFTPDTGLTQSQRKQIIGEILIENGFLITDL